MITRRPTAILLASLLILAGLPALSQSPYFRKTILPPDYRATEVTRMVQDRDGFMWLGTADGVLRFDGIQYRNFLQDPVGDNKVTALFADSTGTVWAGFANGTAGIIRDEKFQNKPGSISEVAITGFAEDDHHRIWISTYGSGIFVLEGDTVINFRQKDGLPDNFIYTLAADPDGRIWAGTDNGIAICRIRANFEVQSLNSTNGLPDNIVTRIVSDGSDRMWIGMESSGYCSYMLSHDKVDVSASPWVHGTVTDIAVWEKNTVWLATVNGIFEADLKNRTMKPVFQEGKEKFPRVTSLLIDREKNAWVTTGTSTLYSGNRSFVFVDGGDVTNVQAIHYGNRGTLWSSTESNLVAIEPNGNVSIVPAVSIAGSKINIISLYEDDAGFLWIGTFDQGVFRYDPKTKKSIRLSEAQGLANNNVLSIDGDGDDIWFATLGGVSRVTLQNASILNARFSTTTFTSENGLGSNFIYKVFVDRKKRVWFATDGKGVTLFEGGKFKNFSTEAGLRSNIIYCVTEDARGDIWISSSQTGIYRFEHDKFQAFTPHHGFRDLAILALAADRKGNLLIASRMGIDILNPRAGTIFYHGEEMGIADIDPNLNAATSDTLGNIWFGTKAGIIKYSTSDSMLDWPVIRINKLLVFLNDRPFTDNNLPYNNNHVSFDYIGFWYHDPEEVTYKVKLDGYDLDWIDSRNRFITYPNLPPGNYTFRVRASATSHFEGAPQQQYAFVIAPPFYQTPIFYALAVAAGAGLIFLFIQNREHRLKLAERQKNEKLAFQFETLKNQVNPHFLFNSFNTLISVIEDDPKTAVEYVEKLSDFYRSILLHREEDLIPLTKELALIDTYYFLQIKRFRNNFRMTIEIQPPETDKLIPPLTLQLLIENAVKHNIISNDKPLLVQVSAADGYLSVKNNLQRKVKYESGTGLGLDNIRSRYALLTEKKVRIEEDSEYFTVHIPLIQK